MRISDWSSDVCSSDLFSELTLRAVRSRSVRVPNFGERYSARAVQEIGVRDACLETSYQANPTRKANCAALMQQLGIPTPYLPSEIGTGYEIGKASGRARERRDVLI